MSRGLILSPLAEVLPGGRLLRFNGTAGPIAIDGNLPLMRLFVGTLHLQYMLGNIVTVTAYSPSNFRASDRVVFQPGLTFKEW